MKMRLLTSVFALCFMAFNAAQAQMEGGVEAFKQDPNAWRRAEEETSQPAAVTPQMRDRIPEAALQNILDAEQAFCYTVAPRANGSKAYTLNGLEVTGFCGILPEIERNLFVDEYLSNEQSVSNVVENCMIQPRIMLRYMRGIDYTDVLYSSPCYSFTIFYAGNVQSFNVTPTAPILDAIVEAYEGQKTDFVSPSLLGQVLPIGIPQNDKQRVMAQEKNAKSPVRSWENNNVPEESEKPAGKGWNNLKFKK